MNLVFLGDRDEIHREGVKAFLLAIFERLNFVETPLFNAWRRHCSTAANEVTREGASLKVVALGLASALQMTLQAQEAAEARCTVLERQLTAAREDSQRYRSWWETLCNATNTKQLRAWQDQVRALERELEQAQATHAALEQRLAEQQQCLAAREAKIAELNRLIARQVAEFDGLFSAMEE